MRKHSSWHKDNLTWLLVANIGKNGNKLGHLPEKSHYEQYQ
jgi:hypothetical protein